MQDNKLLPMGLAGPCMAVATHWWARVWIKGHLSQLRPVYPLPFENSLYLDSPPNCWLLQLLRSTHSFHENMEIPPPPAYSRLAPPSPTRLVCCYFAAFVCDSLSLGCAFQSWRRQSDPVKGCCAVTLLRTLFWVQSFVKSARWHFKITKVHLLFEASQWANQPSKYTRSQLWLVQCSDRPPPKMSTLHDLE